MAVTDLKIADAGGCPHPNAPRPRRSSLWLYYVWGDHRSIGEPILGDEQTARRMLQNIIDTFDDVPTGGTWWRGPKGAVL